MTIKDCLIRLVGNNPLLEKLEEHLAVRRALKALEEWEFDPLTARPWREVFADLGVDFSGDEALKCNAERAE
ncbi:MAG: hypothetical protein OXI80_01310 [Caldilineaceae bacterium]|nr:hypothetical protein [Caldilineaceae bacterium]MDE0336281.1 hypothetical protein [Caldilineaceae bacterium]